MKEQPRALNTVEKLVTLPFIAVYTVSSLPLSTLPYLPLGIMSSIFNALFRSVSNATTGALTKVDAEIIKSTSPPTSDEPRQRVVTDPTPTKPVTHQRSASGGFFPPSPFSPGEGDVSYMTDPSPPDILIPAEIPYIYRRQLAAQAELSGTPIKGKRFLQPATASRGIPIRDPTSAPKATPTQLSEWRKEQLRRQNPPRLMEPIVVKSISALHGPPNLPYARNPSGVDASIPDEPIVNFRDEGHLSPRYSTDILPVPTHHQQKPINRPASAGPTQQNVHQATRVPYQQHIEMTHYPASEGIRKVGSSAEESVSANKPETKLTPSEVLRAQISTIPVLRSLDLIAELAPPPSFPARPSSEIVRKRTMSTSVPSASTVAAQKIVEDVDTYPTTPRYVAATENGTARAASGSSQITITAKSLAEEEATAAAAARAAAVGKADASANWRLKTPIRITAPATSKKPIDIKYTPSADRSDDAPIMTIDSLFEKFAPSSGLSPMTIKVNTPPQADPAVKEISQTPLSTPKTDDLLCPSIPETFGNSPPPTPSAEFSKTSESIVEDLISFTSDPDENTTPTPDRVSPPQKPAAKAKGTPGAGKLLKRGSGGKAGKESKGDTIVTPAITAKAKAPLGAAKTVAVATRSKSRAA